MIVVHVGLMPTWQHSKYHTRYVVGTIHQTFAHYTLYCISVVLKLHIIYVVWRSNPVGHNNWSIECLYPDSKGPVSSIALLTKFRILFCEINFNCHDRGNIYPGRKQLRNDMEIRLYKLIAISILLSLKTAMAWYRFIVTCPIHYSYVL